VWNKRTDETPGQRPPQADVPRAAAPSPISSSIVRSDPAPSLARQMATIGRSMHINGEIRTDEELLVDGEVEGLLESRSLLTVGPNGKVKADIKAREVVIYGSVQGDVEVTEKIAIREQGSLVGNIKTSGISIDDGAYFKGSIDISRPNPQPASKPARSEGPRLEASAAR
jgi:cytoskeletal protein CcmA (bactofilin family)